MGHYVPSASELKGRPHSWRNFEPEEFIHAMQRAERGEPDKAEIEGLWEAFNHVESGRLRDMLRETHSFAVRLDPDELREWKSRNEDMFKWIVAYGFVAPAANRLQQYHDYDGPPYDE